MTGQAEDGVRVTGQDCMGYWTGLKVSLVYVVAAMTGQAQDENLGCVVVSLCVCVCVRSNSIRPPSSAVFVICAGVNGLHLHVGVRMKTVKRERPQSIA